VPAPARTANTMTLFIFGGDGASYLALTPLGPAIVNGRMTVAMAARAFGSSPRVKTWILLRLGQRIHLGMMAKAQRVSSTGQRPNPPARRPPLPSTRSGWLRTRGLSSSFPQDDEARCAA
jgi:hypothetical protein